MTKIEGTFHNKVHCHICAMKDLCKYGDAKTSYRFHHNHYDLDFESQRKERDDDFGAMLQITANCPIRKNLFT